MTCLVYIDRRETARAYLMSLGADESILDAVLSDVFEGELSPSDAANKLGLIEPTGCSIYTVSDAIQDAC